MIIGSVVVVVVVRLLQHLIGTYPLFPDFVLANHGKTTATISVWTSAR
jgi:hypothetical protein